MKMKQTMKMKRLLFPKVFTLNIYYPDNQRYLIKINCIPELLNQNVDLLQPYVRERFKKITSLPIVLTDIFVYDKLYFLIQKGLLQANRRQYKEEGKGKVMIVKMNQTMKMKRLLFPQVFH